MQNELNPAQVILKGKIDKVLELAKELQISWAAKLKSSSDGIVPMLVYSDIEKYPEDEAVPAEEPKVEEAA